MKNKKWAKGQSLIEVLVALGIISIVTTALASVIITSMDNAQLSKNQNLALQYSQEGIEVVRQLRDQDYIAFRSHNNTFCLDKGSNTLESDCTNPNIDNFFLRKVTIVQSGCSANVASAVVAVSWADGKCPDNNTFCRSSKLETCLSTINEVPTL
jgi:prepilin-type N-terminal cleavage/methylation domain-containing protein